MISLVLFRRILPATVLCLLIVSTTVMADGGPAAGISAMAADTSGTPPHTAPEYIAEAMNLTADQNWTEELVVTTRGLAWYPQNAELLCLRAYTYRKMGQYQKSVDDSSKAIVLDPKPVRYANRGYGDLALRNYSAALADAESGIALNASYPTGYAVRALALSGMGRDADAAAAADAAIGLDPGSAHYWHTEGKVLAAAGNCSGAAAAYERSIALNPEYSLPYPGFGRADDDLAALNATCSPRAAATAKSPAAWWGAVAAAAGAAVILRARA